MQYLQNEQVLILGLGISGLSMARWCVRCGARVRVADTRSQPPGLKELQALVPDLEFVAGFADAQLFLSDLSGQPMTRVLRSPGLSPLDTHFAEIMKMAGEKNIPVLEELSLFSEALAHIDQEKRAQEQKVVDAMLEELAKQAQAQALADEAKSAEKAAAKKAAQAALEEAAENNHENRDFDFYEDHEGYEDQDIESEFSDSALDEGDAPIVPPLIYGYQPKVIAITGTNGKTTVTSLTAQLVERAGQSVVAAGNIGWAMMDALAQRLDEDNLPNFWVLELSSFQLDDVKRFEPTVATVLNVTQDHLDWHGDMQQYFTAKTHIFGERTVRVLNRNDAQVMTLVPQAPVEDLEQTGKKKRKTVKKPQLPAVITFGVDAPSRAGDFGLLQENGITWLVRAQMADETMPDSGELLFRKLIPTDVLQLKGQHNLSNALASLALACEAGCELAPMLFALRDYKGEPHRTQWIANVNGVDYIEDSKGTNVGATAAALQGLGPDHRLVVILGGDGKGQDFSPLLPLVKQFVRAVVLIGRDAALIEQALQSAQVPLLHAQDMSEAVNLCAQNALAGDMVLMSPACASLDMYTNYVVRAQAFVEAVEQLQKNGESLNQFTGGAA